MSAAAHFTIAITFDGIGKDDFLIKENEELQSSIRLMLL